ncbi:MAG: NAD-dependent epimerase/dehydratase family protein [Actinobacteria bacterium]|nr:NAD-dependent epimerase/dehydratase family protein [Actinomycetota bacterium]
MKVLITGGAGFIGQHLARRLVTDGHELVALDHLLGQVHLDPEASVAAFPGEVIVGDVADEEAWASLPDVDAVVHLAAETGTGQSMYEVDRYRRVNIGGTELAGRFAAAQGAPIVALSSRAVYGEGRHGCPEHGVTFGAVCCDRATAEDSQEGDEHRPVSVYGETKSEGERALDGVTAQIPVTTIRPQNVIGPGQALHNPYTGVLAAFLAMLKEGKPLTVYGEGTQTRDFIHVQDLAAIIAWALTNPGDIGTHRVFNAGSGVRTTLVELADHAASGAPIETHGITHLDIHRAGDIDDACADMSAVAAAGAPMPQWSTRDAVADFIRSSWEKPGAPADAWDKALGELKERGLTS